MDHKTRLKQYATLFWSALVVIAISIGSFLYTFLAANDDGSNLFDNSGASESFNVEVSDDGTAYVNPGNVVPSGPPSANQPTSPIPKE